MRLKEVNGHWCFAEGSIPCGNVTIVAKTDPIEAHDRNGDGTEVHGVVALIRHGAGEIVVFSFEFEDSDQGGLGLVKIAMEYYLGNEQPKFERADDYKIVADYGSQLIPSALCCFLGCLVLLFGV